MIIIKKKYYLFSNNKKITSANTIKELKEKLLEKNQKNKECILLKLSKQKISSNTNLNLIGGPIKITLKIYDLFNNKLKLKYEEKKNKKGEYDLDKRNAQYLYYTTEYYIKHGINIEDLRKVSSLALKNKLEKRPFAQKLITQI